MISVARAREALRRIRDPELGFDIVSLGFVYDVRVGRRGEVRVRLILSAPGCPLVGYFEEEARRALKEAGAREVEVEFLDNPLWSPERAEPAVRRALGAGGSWRGDLNEGEVLGEFTGDGAPADRKKKYVVPS